MLVNTHACTVSSQTKRLCPRCSARLPVDQDGAVHKHCEDCRRKDREMEERRQERKRMLAQLNRGTAPVRLPFAGFQPTSSPMAEVPPAATALASLPQKRKADADDLPSESQVRPTKMPVRKLNRTEYQTQDRLYDALDAYLDTSEDATFQLNFHGGFTIVLDPDIRPTQRVEIVVEELRERTRLPLGQLVMRVNGILGGYTAHHWCTCMGIAPPPPPKRESQSIATAPTPFPASTPAIQPGAPSAQPAKRNQRTLMNWLASAPKPKRKSVAHSQTSAQKPKDYLGRGVCGGTISVEVVPDFSHPLADAGLRGQRVTLCVQHPGRVF
ncbi:hypothetical protein BN946_scf185008.g88 [Trametes cinnabarina]|uniref:Uncharacterized protein n=1 Tax=Pycnoporus cinnabarinus TaxID=5643 RepID=A0A060SG48_PYCCI|nr:hypothetical protein BN946_scf185008.g88 [Trametes cinnabarina]